jgi:hypothetical protein
VSVLTDRIAEVLRATPLDMGPFLGGKGRVPDEWAAHVAERVAAELHLTEEWGFHHPDDPIDEPSGWCEAADYEGMTSRPVSHRRWVSAWSEVQS